MSKWNPDLYMKFADERTQPSRDLLARVNLSDPTAIVDIGCGSGNSTQVLCQRWPEAQITGLDSSPEMIEKARRAYPQQDWVLADAASWQPETPFDLVFSNATLQWIPDHDQLVPALFAQVREGGALAVQVPANQSSPLHQAVLRVSQTPAWRDSTAGCSSLLNYREPGYYYDLLSRLSGQLQVWTTTYYHVMATHQGLIDWYSSTGMRPYLDRLASEDLRREFQAQVLEACRAEYPAQQDGKILFPFQRLFFVANKV